MLILKIVSVVICAMLITLFIKNFNAAFVPFIALGTGLLAIYMVLPYVNELIVILNSITRMTSGLETYFSTIIKIVIIALIGEFSAQLCSDAGENYLSTQIYFATKIIMMYQISPIFIRFIKTIVVMVQEL